MKTRASHVILFLAGAASMFLLERLPVFRKEPEKPVIHEEPTQTRATRAPAKPDETARHPSVRLEELLRCVKEIKDYTALENFAKNLRGEDAPDLLAILMEEAGPNGPDGTDYTIKKMLESAIDKWVDEDVQTALEWAAAQTKPKIRRYLQTELLSRIAKTDPFRAANLALDIQHVDAEFDVKSVIFGGVFKLCETSGNEKKIAELLRKTAGKKPDQRGYSHANFPEDFSHETLLNEIAAMEREGLYPPSVPAGMLKAWAKQDAEAAHAWFLTHGAVGCEGWSDVLEGVVSTAGQQDAAQWFTRKYRNADDVMRETMSEAFYDKMAENDIEQRMELADSMARQMEPKMAVEFVNNVLKRRIRISDREGLSLLSWYPTPEARADLIVEDDDLIEAIFTRCPEKKLITFGITRATLEAAIERKKAAAEHQEADD